MFNVCNKNQLYPHTFIMYVFVYLGNGLTLQLIRKNQQCNVSEALAPIDINLQYDFNYQQFTFLPKEVRVFPVSRCPTVAIK